MHVVCFKQTPDIEEIKKRLVEQTGLEMRFKEEHTKTLTVIHPERPKSMVEMDWVDKVNRHCVRIESSTPKCNYVEASVLFLLKKMGGDVEEVYALPQWAGKQWKDVWPNSSLARLIAWWKRSLSI